MNEDNSHQTASAGKGTLKELKNKLTLICLTFDIKIIIIFIY